MGWAYGVDSSGREIGYAVEAVCDWPGCENKIDRGLSYVCGEMHGGTEHGCGDYFCGSHLTHGSSEQLCLKCAEREECEEE